MKTINSNDVRKSLVYMDNAATSWPKPPAVPQEIEKCLSDYCANPGRGTHRMAEKSMNTVNGCRKKFAKLISAPDYQRVVFTKNCTEATNHLLYGYLRPGDHVVISPMEHNAVMRPLWHLQNEKNVKLDYLDLNNLLNNPKGELQRKVTAKTRLIVCMLSSNVTGTIFPIEDIGLFAKSKGIPLFVDASQGVGSVELNVGRANVGMVAFPGHKNLYGPQGTGGFWVANYIELNPLLKGGTGHNTANKMQGNDFPNEYESGTLNVPGIAGLSCGIDFINTYGLERIRREKNVLVEQLNYGFSKMKGVHIHSEKCIARNSGIISINIDGFNSQKVAKLLDENYNIAVRGGLHCAPQAHTQIGTMHQGCVRFSPGIFNTVYDVEKCLRAVYEIWYNK